MAEELLEINEADEVISVNEPVEEVKDEIEYQGFDIKPKPPYKRYINTKLGDLITVYPVQWGEE